MSDKSFWLDSKASVILLPSGKQGDDLFALASSWSEVGIIGSALWVKPEGIQRVNGEPPRIVAEVIGIGAERELISVKVDVFEQLARENLKLVRLIKVRAVSAKREEDELQDEIVGLIETYLRRSMPSLDKSLNDRDAFLNFDVVNLICAPTEFKAKERFSVETTNTGITIIAAPEDRTTPWSVDAFIRDNNKFLGFTLIHISTCAGIWRGLPFGTLELVKREKSSRDGVYISRNFVAGVLTDGLARRVAASVLIDSASPDFEPPIPPEGTAYIEDGNLDSYIATMVDEAFKLDNSILEYQRPPLVGDLNKQKIGILAQLKSFFLFFGQKTVKMPYWVWMWVKRKFARKIQNELQGKDGRFEVGIGLDEPVDTRDSLLLARYATVKASEEKARNAMHTPVQLTELRSTPSLWQGLRELIFGSLDAGFDLGNRGFGLLDGGKAPIFRKISNLFQNVDDIWKTDVENLPEGVPNSLGWDKLADASDLEAKLRAWVEGTNTEVDIATARVAEINKAIDKNQLEVSEMRQHLIELGLITIDDDGTDHISNLSEAAALQKKFNADPTVSEDVQADSNLEPTDDLISPAESASTDETQEIEYNFPNLIRHYKSLLAEAKKLTSELEEHDGVADAVNESLPLREQVLGSFIEWKTANERSFLWKMQVRMKDRLASVSSDLQSYRNRLESIEMLDQGRLLSLRKGFHKSVLILTGAVVLVTISVIIWYDQVKQNRPQANVPTPAEVIAYAVVVWLSLYTSFMAAYHRGWSKFERQVDVILSDLSNIAEGNRKCRSEDQRLNLLYKQTIDWLELLASALSRPWSVKPNWLDSGFKELDLESLPFAMSIARANDADVTAFEKLRSASISYMTHRGWRYKAFEHLVDEIAQVSSTTRGMSIEMLDRDLPHASNNSRQAFRSHLGDAIVQERVAVSFLKPMIEKLQSEAMAEARPNVLEVEDDPLEALRSDIEGIETVTKEIPWSNFLSRILTRGETTPDPITPLSVLGIAEGEIYSGVHESVTTYALMPERVAIELGKSVNVRLNVVTYSDKTARPFDAVIRVDIAGPIDPQSTRLWSNPKPSAPTPDREPIGTGVTQLEPGLDD